MKAGRGFQWVKWEFLGMGPCLKWQNNTEDFCLCPLGVKRDPDEKLGLMWTGEKYYPKPEDFMAEARAQGVSKRIPAVPRDFVLGKTWLALAHRKAISRQVMPPQGDQPVTEYHAAVFSLFLPTEIQYVVTGEETDEQLEAMEKKGITPVQVVYDDAEHVTDGNEA